MLLLALFSSAFAATSTTYYLFQVLNATTLEILSRGLKYEEYEGANYTALNASQFVPFLKLDSDGNLVTDDGGRFSFNSLGMTLTWDVTSNAPAPTSEFTLSRDGYLSYHGTIEFGYAPDSLYSFHPTVGTDQYPVYFRAETYIADDFLPRTTTTTTTTSDTNTTTSTSWDYCMGIWEDSAHWGSDCQYVGPTTTSSTTSYSLYLPTLPTNCDDLSDYLAGYPTELHSLLPSGFCTSVPGDSGVNTSTYSLYLPTLPTNCDDLSDFLAGYPTELHSLLPSGFCTSVPGNYSVPTDKGTKTESKTVTETVCTEPTCADVPSDKGTKTESKTVTETVCTEPTCTNVPSEKGTKTGSKTVTETACTEPTCTDVAPKDAAPSKALANLAALVGVVANLLMI